MDFDINFLCFCNKHCNRHYLVTDGIILNILFKIVQAWYLVTNSWTSKLPVRFLQKVDWAHIRSELSAFRPIDGLLKLSVCVRVLYTAQPGT